MSGPPENRSGQRTGDRRGADRVAPQPAARVRPVFLEKASYRRRRLTDAVRLMPVLGALLWAVPMLWPGNATATSVALLYVFGIWAVLVIGAALLSRGIGRMSWADSDADGDGDGEAH